MSETLSFSQILAQIKSTGWTSSNEKLEYLHIQNPAHRQSVVKKLRWFLFQYERDMFFTQEVIEFFKFGCRDHVRAFIKDLFHIGINPFKQSWRKLIDSYQGPAYNAKTITVGEILAKNFFKVIGDSPYKLKNEEHEYGDESNNIKITHAGVPKNLFEVVNLIQKSNKQQFTTIKNKPIQSPNIISLLENVQGTNMKKASEPIVLTRKPVEEAILNLKSTNLPVPKFRTDRLLSISWKFLLSKDFSRNKGQLDPPDIFILNEELPEKVEKCLAYKKHVIDNRFYYITNMIKDNSLGLLGNYNLGVDFILKGTQLIIPFNWNRVKSFKYGYFVTAPDVVWYPCLSKIFRESRKQLEKWFKEVKI